MTPARRYAFKVQGCVALSKLYRLYPIGVAAWRHCNRAGVERQQKMDDRVAAAYATLSGEHRLSSAGYPPGDVATVGRLATPE